MVFIPMHPCASSPIGNRTITERPANQRLLVRRILDPEVREKEEIEEIEDRRGAEELVEHLEAEEEEVVEENKCCYNCDE
jgi:hypothetical protein